MGYLGICGYFETLTIIFVSASKDKASWNSNIPPPVFLRALSKVGAPELLHRRLVYDDRWGVNIKLILNGRW